MIEKLIRCARCNEVIPHYQNSIFSHSLPGVEWSSEDLSRQEEFFQAHREHPIEEISVDPNTLISDRTPSEPIKVSYFEASNGTQKFLIRRTKDRLDRPARYEIIPGQLRVSNVSLKVQERDLRKQISSPNGYIPLSEEKVTRFIQALKEEVESIPPEKFSEEIDIQEGETTLLAYGTLKESHWENILRRCGQGFKTSEMEKIRQFIDENREPGDVLALEVARRITIFTS